MADEIVVKISADDELVPVLRKVGDTTTDVAKSITSSMGSTEQAFDTAARNSGVLGSALDKTAGAGAQLADGMDGLASGIASVRDVTMHGARAADEQARKELAVGEAFEDVKQKAQDLRQAQRALNQSVIDGEQAVVDQEQAENNIARAMFEAEQAQKAYNTAVQEYGPSSAEAKEAALGLRDANTEIKNAKIELKQAEEYGKQAQEDGTQAQIDGTTAVVEGKKAVVDLREASRESVPLTGIEKFGSELTVLAPAVTGLVSAIELLAIANTALHASFIKATVSAIGQRIATIAGSIATGVATAAQWLWNLALSMNPIGLVVIAIVALIAVIVLIATKTTWFQDMWHAVWGKIGEPVKTFGEWVKAYYSFMIEHFLSGIRTWWDLFTGFWGAVFDGAHWAFDFVLSIPDRIGNAFRGIGDAIAGPFRWGLNMISRAWNSTIGKLHWDFPSIFGVGGFSISAPTLPSFAAGTDEVLSTGLAMIHRGESIVPATARGYTGDSRMGMELTITVAPGADNQLIRALLSLLNMQIRTGALGAFDKAAPIGLV